ncbi:unnamed protein product [Timema podura]|uniref:Uncharacterized protein n=1 Tax=Timema podura TaxID=61482 RepID=A0ABN7PF56_TIMPD|nr:unnamed protein product [Timema podura]
MYQMTAAQAVSPTVSRSSLCVNWLRVKR